MIKFAKTGSDVTTAAVKLSRAYTGRPLVAVCANHPFFSVDDWFIGSTAMSGGILKQIQDLTVKFRFNDLASVEKLFAEHSEQIACLMMEAVRTEEPEPEFLAGVQKLCKENGTLFVLDEMMTGFRCDISGAQGFYGLEPDLSTFGKAMGNGFSIAALLGKRDVMELGGLDHDKERVFLLSTTHGAETHALAAGMKVLEIYQKEDVISALYAKGDKLRQGIKELVDCFNLEGHFGVLGRPDNMIYYTRDQDENLSQPFRTLFLQETIKRGLLMPSLVVSYSHTDEVIDETLEALSGALAVYRAALDEGIEHYLVGRPIKPVFRRFN